MLQIAPDNRKKSLSPGVRYGYLCSILYMTGKQKAWQNAANNCATKI